MIKKCEDAGIKNLNDPSAFIEYSNTTDDVYKKLMITIQEEREKFFVVFDDMIADIMTNKRLQDIIKELFIRCKKLNISLVFYHTVLF